MMLYRRPHTSWKDTCYLGPEAQGRFWAIGRNAYGCPKGQCGEGSIARDNQECSHVARVELEKLLSAGCRVYVRIEPRAHVAWIGPIMSARTAERLLEHWTRSGDIKLAPEGPEAYVCPPRRHWLSQEIAFTNRAMRFCSEPIRVQEEEA